jgi:hypothetical protein
MKTTSKISVLFILVFSLMLCGKVAVCQDYEGTFCKAEMIEVGPGGQYNMLENLCICLSKYDGEQIFVGWKNNISKLPEPYENKFKQVSPGVFELPAVYGGPAVSYFIGDRVRVISSNKVVFTRYDGKGITTYKIIYTR